MRSGSSGDIMTAAGDEHRRWLVGVEAGDGRGVADTMTAAVDANCERGQRLAKPTFCRAFGKENSICQTD